MYGNSHLTRGCEEWITDELLKIMKLAHWKDTMKEKKQLSVRELTTRALEIDRKLKRHCPDVPEIHDNVSKTIDAFKALPQPELIRSLSWPLCIAGSMATEDQQAAFLEITTKAKIHRYPFGSSNHALAIIQECWRMRDDENLADGNVDWMVAMRNLGLNVLLA
ncbi:putative Uncharacterized transcriptional regulatory protein [Glarea lozoyensis 74030]|uniref:Putative Uncharacterized transcriptional regulatory protein n=1 Tax=Glarea lozoyensis (strain ATCC 74030 / MF5533) TaxID=1104152 RepID=H0EZJ3_GLAL7|nr:putative Uncharacterized transcriptional regulatory protein [Glarea lozoyensis 74030]